MLLLLLIVASAVVAPRMGRVSRNGLIGSGATDPSVAPRMGRVSRNPYSG